MEFQLVFPQKWMKSKSIVRIQSQFRKFKAKRVAKSKLDEHSQRAKVSRAPSPFTTLLCLLSPAPAQAAS